MPKYNLSRILLLLLGLDYYCAALPYADLGAGTSTRLGKLAHTRGQETRSTTAQVAKRRLTGKFLHITDIHPDPFYKTHSSTEGDHACHRGKGPAGYYGAETSDCDSPLTLLNATFDWMKQHIKDDIDFVVWTGDSARHDNDEKHPRSVDQVVKQNELVLSKFKQVWGTPSGGFEIPIVPTLGNNDILPHNIFEAGPNKWTKRYLDIWRSVIPEEQRHNFARGGWFCTEVITDKLAVISLNTLYFFDSNSAVDGCANKHEPGYEHFEWLRIQLQLLRERGMKAMLIGHVPPARVDSKMSWDETCWQKYTLWLKQYRDVIVSSFYGHMNIDHFMLQDFKDINKDYKKGYGAPVKGLKAKYAADEELTTMSATDYLMDLRDLFSQIPSLYANDAAYSQQDAPPVSMPDMLAKKKKKKKDPIDKIGGEYAERYSLAFVQASIVPNFLPTIRVFEYNITGLESASSWATQRHSAQKPMSDNTQAPLLAYSPESDEDIESRSETSIPHGFQQHAEVSKQKKKKQKKKKKYKFIVPQKPSKTAPPGPAYSPQTLSLLGYTEYIANLTYINNDFAGADNNEAISPPATAASLPTGHGPRENGTGEIDADRWKEGKHHGKAGSGRPHPKPFAFTEEYDTFSDRIFDLRDLTVRSYVDLARRIGASEKVNSKLRETPVSTVPVPGADAEFVDGLDAECDEEMEVLGKKKRKKEVRRKIKRVWHTFIRRAFVGTIEPEELEERFTAWRSGADLERTGRRNEETGGDGNGDWEL